MGDCHVDVLQKPLDRAALAHAQVAYLTVSGMGCPRCATRVNNSLLTLDGVLLSEIVLAECLAAVAYDPERVTPADLVQAVADAGNDGHHRYAARFLVQVPPREALRIYVTDLSGR
jgi:copper chaperone CopZ